MINQIACGYLWKFIIIDLWIKLKLGFSTLHQYKLNFDAMIMFLGSIMIIWITKKI